MANTGYPVDSKGPYPQLQDGQGYPQPVPPPYGAQTQTTVYTTGGPQVVMTTGTPAMGPTVVMSGPAFVLGPHPSAIECPHCKSQVVTNVHHESGLLTYLLSGGLLLFGCWLGCCLIPCCMDGCKDVTHTCPGCKKFIGTYKRL